jgi:ribulose-5-phosphate 4-epimerase/fuculose-1-phosphate aldolase
MATAAKLDTGTTNSETSAAEWRARVDLAAAYRLVALYGWDDLIFTHLSARVPGPEHHFLINPYDMMFEEITASSLVKIDVDGNPVGPSEHPVNPAGFTIHSAIHMAREDAAAVMHLHTPYGQAVSAMEFGLLPHTQTAMIAKHNVAYHDYEGIATDLDERERLVADLGDKKAMILRNHGTLTVGETVGDCFLRLYFLERACEAQVYMLSAGLENLNTPPQGVEDKVAGQSKPQGMGRLAERLAWPALLRKLDRVNPGYDS